MSRIAPAAVAALLGLGCTAKNRPEAQSEPVAKAAGPAEAPPASDPPAAKGPSRAPLADPGCADKVERYLSERAALNGCDGDSDCAEVWPGLCPHRPYYIRRTADPSAVWALRDEIEQTCELPECEPPPELGPAHCEAGKCVAGRAPATESPDESCWDYREQYLEPTGAASMRTVSGIQGITPHVVIVPAAAGTLRLTLDWPSDCTDCELVASEHNSGMARTMDTTPKRTEEVAGPRGSKVRRAHLELPVTPGPYHFVATSSRERSVIVRAELVDASGAPGRVTHHGTAWVRMCEG